ncbi:SDR family NAD(P)-dependent oxidoreductase [Rhodospirillaceae bacterium KN72]|uniref:SDR family NAD(P)-dependent oxidoreductase n=1 Tax=Pacificispira spongiicola TaxID=2729598 RepID=A0A7Y0E0I3_9PROT|nr:SDR family NAD(P)-dependent oxidoreductase [Pacificispira spongiicola]NMM44236.1 SDR family NAD(P)-dependent oxidoreductase [Pacificispira spongiicola]
MTTILITGASSGIGEALAKAYAEPGNRLCLSGRDETRLNAVATQCRDAGASVDTAQLDVTDRDSMRTWIEACDDAAPLDIVVANAGIAGEADEDAVRRIFDVNLTGVLNTVHPALDRMLARKSGTIALVSSIAGNRGFPSAPAYSAAKAAVLAYAEGLRGKHGRDGVTVCAVCPGFVRSRITDANDFPMPFFMEADRAAATVRKGLARGTAKISFPWQMRLSGWLMRALPSGLGTTLTARLPEKGS